MTTTETKPKTTTPTTTPTPTTTLANQVLEQLGTPEDLYRVDVRKVGKGRARVNVWRNLPIEPTVRFGVVERSCFSHKHQITDSFYCQVNSGILISASPSIERRYEA